MWEYEYMLDMMPIRMLHVFLFMFYTFLTGVVILGIYWGARRLLHRKDDIIFNYYSLKVIAWSFTLPIVACFLWCQTHELNGTSID